MKSYQTLDDYVKFICRTVKTGNRNKIVNVLRQSLNHCDHWVVWRSIGTILLRKDKWLISIVGNAMLEVKELKAYDYIDYTSWLSYVSNKHWRAFNYLAKAARSQNYQLRSAVACVLWMSKREQALYFLDLLINDISKDVRQSAKFSLDRMNCELSFDELRSCR